MVVAFLIIWSIWIDQERDESICKPSNLYEVTLSMVCEEIVSNGRFALASRPSTISLVLEVLISMTL